MSTLTATVAPKVADDLTGVAYAYAADVSCVLDGHPTFGTSTVLRTTATAALADALAVAGFLSLLDASRVGLVEDGHLCDETAPLPPYDFTVLRYEVASGQITDLDETYRGTHGTYKPACSECRAPAASDDVHAAHGMCGACLHDAQRAGWTPGCVTE